MPFHVRIYVCMYRMYGCVYISSNGLFFFVLCLPQILELGLYENIKTLIRKYNLKKSGDKTG